MSSIALFSGKTKTFIKKETNRTLQILFVFVFCLLPLIFLLFNLTKGDFNYIFSDDNFFLALKNSFLYSFLSATIVTFLALISAYLLNRSSIKHKKVFVLLLTFSMLVPTISVGLGIRLFFGERGFADVLFSYSTSLLGLPGLVIGSVIISFPPTFLIIYDALKYENKAPYDAAEIMGISRISTFFKITLPYLKWVIVSAFFASFTLIFSDYGVPMEVAGGVKTLPIYLYEQVMTTFQYGRGAVVSLFLLLPALLSFVVELFNKESNHDLEGTDTQLSSTKKFNTTVCIFLTFVGIVLLIPTLSFSSLAFLKSFPNNLTFTFDHIKSIFTKTTGVGIPKYIVNSLLIAIGTSLFGTVLCFIMGYYTVRKPGRLAKVLNAVAMSSLAIPGIVLGVGYIFLFKGTNGFFYGTFLILIFVNVIHFMGQPFIMAKNCMMKLNKDYELVGNTLGISKLRIFGRVIVPQSKNTLLEMFTYYFLNSMITISAVAFLCSFQNQPLSILISTFEKSANYEMQAVISFVLVFINVVAKTSLEFTRKVLNSKNKIGDNNMVLSRYQFELLTFIEKNGRKKYGEKVLSDAIGISMTTIGKLLKESYDNNWLQLDDSMKISITEIGSKMLDPYKVRRAIILAAGFGSRLAPVTLDTPKPLVKVNGVRIIDTVLDALLRQGIDNIYIVRGYKKESFDILLEKYPTIRFIDNEEYNCTNNISSLIKALDVLDRCYICEADLLISNPDLIRKYEFNSNYLGAKVNETDDWCFHKVGRYISKYEMGGGEDCYQAFGISYWSEADCKKLKSDAIKVYNSRAGKENFWDAIPFKYCKKNYQIEIRKCHKADIVEIDNFSELVDLDESYKDYPGHEDF